MSTTKQAKSVKLAITVDLFFFSLVTLTLQTCIWLDHPVLAFADHCFGKGARSRLAITNSVISVLWKSKQRVVQWVVCWSNTGLFTRKLQMNLQPTACFSMGTVACPHGWDLIFYEDFLLNNIIANVEWCPGLVLTSLEWETFATRPYKRSRYKRKRWWSVFWPKM